MKRNTFLVIYLLLCIFVIPSWGKESKPKLELIKYISFPEKRWMVAMPNQKTGGYESFFQPGPNFSRNFSSIKWNEIP